MKRIKNVFMSAIGVGAFLVAGSMGFSTSAAAGGFCPGEDYCYTAGGCSNCKNNNCHGYNCPDAGEQGSNCYVCA
jgi:hypothetical protein